LASMHDPNHHPEASLRGSNSRESDACRTVASVERWRFHAPRIVAGSLVAALVSSPQPLMAQAPATLTVTNARAVKATSIEVISGSQVVARHPRPLAPGAKARIRLPKLKDCLVAITASFEDGAEISADGQDACTDKSVRRVD
jgi:hypothetical protein